MKREAAQCAERRAMVRLRRWTRRAIDRAVIAAVMHCFYSNQEMNDAETAKKMQLISPAFHACFLRRR
ncbi:hypothetical protein ET464_15885 [Paenibacillus protaetiae]|uniref:HTH araC/xylS-type domain-containing protein n=1 Tax=Paenibacillus protaetiae TaxID=2509456 RepID=A0A4P6EX75_9BACL|nr:hypothetical protein ET464_15885 [Paenibacillus protaetiae]